MFAVVAFPVFVSPEASPRKVPLKVPPLKLVALIVVKFAIAPFTILLLPRFRSVVAVWFPRWSAPEADGSQEASPLVSLVRT